MLATFVIGLREGLEAALIVGIVAAFLKRNGRRLTAMWWGVGAALALSVAVGTTLWLVEAALPQAAQEGMETVIGAVAVVFVTGMVLWMNRHGRTMKKDLEASATEALGSGTARALAVMAFLAVLKEGFETSVFLLATFRAAGSAGSAASGALLGIAAAVVVGAGIYAGGVHLNLARFFRITGVFLLLVAAGLVLTAVRTAHEAGWLAGGQQRTVDLSWLAPTGSVQAALVTGVLGIPGDPRLIEVVAWLAYLVPVALLVYWPAARRPSARTARALRIGVAGTLVAAAAVLAVAVPLGLRAAAAPVSLALADGGSARLTGRTVVITGPSAATVTLPAASSAVEHLGVAARQFTVSTTEQASRSTVTLATLTADNGGRVPVGLNPAADPGPFTVRSTPVGETTVWTVGARLLDLRRSTATIGQLTGGGLAGARTLTLSTAAVTAAQGAAASAADTASDEATLAPERVLWGVQVPLVLLAAGVLTLLASRRRTSTPTAPMPRSTRSTTYAVR